jgi:hypothetical protein
LIDFGTEAPATKAPSDGDGKEVDAVAEFQPLTRMELDRLAGETLPERAAMSLVNANIAIPIDAAIAANVLSDHAVAIAQAVQTTPIDQST